MTVQSLIMVIGKEDNALMVYLNLRAGVIISENKYNSQIFQIQLTRNCLLFIKFNLISLSITLKYLQFETVFDCRMGSLHWLLQCNKAMTKWLLFCWKMTLEERWGSQLCTLLQRKMTARQQHSYCRCVIHFIKQNLSI